MQKTKVEIYNAAVAVAQDQLDTPGNLAFEARMSAKAEALGLSDAEYAQFAGDARQVRSRLLELKRQDDIIAAQAVAAAKNKPADPAA